MGDGDEQIALARRLRTEEGLSVIAIQQRLGVSRTKVRAWLRGLPPPAWTRRPNAKDDLRALAMRLRAEGWSVNDIALEIGVAQSTAWLWVRHLPLDPNSERAERKRVVARRAAEERRREHRAVRQAHRADIEARAAAGVGEPTERELLLLGAAIYWCEGSKSKPWRPHDVSLCFTNSDPGLLALFLRFLESVGIDRTVASYRVSIHETADATAATRWWAETLGLPLARFLRPTLKRHIPSTRRHNVGEGYHGCLIIWVPRSQELYRRLAGIMTALGGPLAGGHRQAA